MRGPRHSCNARSSTRMRSSNRSSNSSSNRSSTHSSTHSNTHTSRHTSRHSTQRMLRHLLQGRQQGWHQMAACLRRRPRHRSTLASPPPRQGTQPMRNSLGRRIASRMGCPPASQLTHSRPPTTHPKGRRPILRRGRTRLPSTMRRRLDRWHREVTWVDLRTVRCPRRDTTLRRLHITHSSSHTLAVHRRRNSMHRCSMPTRHHRSNRRSSRHSNRRPRRHRHSSSSSGNIRSSSSSSSQLLHPSAGSVNSRRAATTRSPHNRVPNRRSIRTGSMGAPLHRATCQGRPTHRRPLARMQQAA
mmetsp:Transcript_20711/g.61844  ORF Transcript_20711/g.61844 Transcript_20711/m.61844 type:complete len:301 (-) Transcript_20711:1586-2488(-)